MMKPTPADNPNTRETWEKEFDADGFWENNAGRKQTRMFAQFFHRHVRVPLSGSFSLLDVGCAVGDALPVWHKKYPSAKLTGMDISQRAIDRARQEFGKIATFQQGGFDDISGRFDVIYCSNVLEHFDNHIDIARKLLACCSILYIMTPYAELASNGRPVSAANPEALHVATFLDDTFDELASQGGASVERTVIRCPVAWGPSLPVEILWHIRYALGMIHAPSPPRRQIIYTIRKSTQ